MIRCTAPSSSGGRICRCCWWRRSRSPPVGPRSAPPRRDGGSLSLLGAGLVVVPLFAGLLHSCTQLLADEHVGVLQLARRMPGILTCAWRVTVPITSVALLAGAAGAAWQRGGQPWMLVSLGMCVAVLAVVVVVGVMALPYSLLSNGGGREVWLVGAFLATRHPVLVLGVLSACSRRRLRRGPSELRPARPGAGAVGPDLGRCGLRGETARSSAPRAANAAACLIAVSSPSVLLSFAVTLSPPGRSFVASLDWPVVHHYDATHLDRISLPIGGIGTGTIGLGGRGDLRDFEVGNRPGKGFRPESAFFAVRAEVEGRRTAGAGRRGTGADLAVRGRVRFAGGPPRAASVRAASFEVAYPFGQVRLRDDDFPVAVDPGGVQPVRADRCRLEQHPGRSASPPTEQPHRSPTAPRRWRCP